MEQNNVQLLQEIVRDGRAVHFFDRDYIHEGGCTFLFGRPVEGRRKFGMSVCRKGDAFERKAGVLMAANAMLHSPKFVDYIDTNEPLRDTIYRILGEFGFEDLSQWRLQFFTDSRLEVHRAIYGANK
jgi:hypothetical protein